MAANARTFLKDMQKFTDESMRWCAQESETESTRIHQTLTFVITDIQRRSALSTTALAAVSKFKEELQARGPVTPLRNALQALGEDAAVGELVAPIIEALQFQDRLRQNLENTAKIIKVWLNRRSDLAAATGNLEDKLTVLGKELLTCTTSREERDLIRTLFPGLPEEVKVDDVQLF